MSSAVTFVIMSSLSTTAGLASQQQAASNGKKAADIDYSPVMQRLRRHFKTGKTRSLDYRRVQLRALRKMLCDNIDAFVEALRKDLGRHPQMCLFGDLYGSVTAVDDALDHLTSWASPREKGGQLEFFGASTRLVPQPKGVMLLVTAWNFPVDFVFNCLSQMLAAGNCVVIKPSEVSANVEQLFVKLIPQYLDNDLVTVVTGGVAESTAVLREKFDHICFTGNGFVGRLVHQAAAKHLTPVTLELGGKGPAIVTKNADIQKAATRIVFSKFFNNGQICAAADHVLVERSVAARFVAAVRNVLKQYPNGPLDEKNPNYARLVHTRHWDRVASLVDCNHGGEIICGGTANGNRDTKFFPVTVILNPDVNSKLMVEEIFGPVLPIITVDSVDDAIAFTNSREKPLVAYVFTQSSTEAQRVTDAVLSGTGAVNECALQFACEGIPFGGVGESGIGRYHGIYGFEEFSHMKPVLDRGWWPLWTDIVGFLRYPPFTQFNTTALRAAVLYKGYAMSFIRKLAAFLRAAKNLALVYFIVVGMMVTFQEYFGKSP